MLLIANRHALDAAALQLLDAIDSNPLAGTFQIGAMQSGAGSMLGQDSDVGQISLGAKARLLTESYVNARGVLRFRSL